VGEKWPRRLWIVRHGESAGNVARDAAHAAGHAVIDIAQRDVDVPLSRLGEQQSRALGHWFAAQPEQPDVILTSPYLRARRTAMLSADVGGVGSAAEDFTIDERLPSNLTRCHRRASCCLIGGTDKGGARFVRWAQIS